MGKKIFGIYLAKLDLPNSEAHARLELPASPWELHDAMDKVQLQENEELYLEIDDYYGFEYLAPHLMELDASLNELNDLAGRLAVLDETGDLAKVDAIHLGEASYISMDYMDRFTVKMPYQADFSYKLRVLELAINSDKIQDNMTGTFDMRQKDGQVIFDQDTRK